MGDRYHEACSITALGDTHHDAGDHGAARALWLDALTIYDDLGHPDVEELRVKLG